MRLDHRLLNWGVFLIALGAIPLALRAGYLSTDAVGRVWTLWPLLLVAAGAGLLLRRTPLQLIGGAMAAGVFGVILGGLLAGGTFPSVACGPDRNTTAFPDQQGSLGSSAEIELRLDCGDVTVVTVAGGAWSVSGSTDGGRLPRIESSGDRVEIRSPDRGDVGFLGSPDHLVVSLPQQTAVDLDVHLNAGSGHLQLAGAHLDRLALEVNAGGADLDLTGIASIAAIDVRLNAVGNGRLVLPNANLSGSIQANAAGNLRLCAPDGVGLRLTGGDNFASSNNFDQRGLVRVGDAWQTPGYAGASARIDLVTKVNAGRINLEPLATCGG